MPEICSEVCVEELALMARKGDREARNTLFLRLQGRIAWSVYPARRLVEQLTWRGGGPIAPEDVMQQAFVIFCALVDEWEPLRAPFVPYMSKMMRLRAYHYVRACFHSRASQGEQFRPQVGRTSTNGQSEQIDPDIQGALVEGSELWNRLVACLTEDRKRFVAMKFRKDLSTNQIARLTNRPPHAVNRYIRSALRLIRRHAEEGWEAL